MQDYAKKENELTVAFVFPAVFSCWLRVGTFVVDISYILMSVGSKENHAAIYITYPEVFAQSSLPQLLPASCWHAAVCQRRLEPFSPLLSENFRMISMHH